MSATNTRPSRSSLGQELGRAEQYLRLAPFPSALAACFTGDCGDNRPVRRRISPCRCRSVGTYTIDDSGEQHCRLDYRADRFKKENTVRFTPKAWIACRRSERHSGKGILAGLIGGLVGTIVMTQFQNAWSKASQAVKNKNSDQGSQEEQKHQGEQEKMNKNNRK